MIYEFTKWLENFNVDWRQRYRNNGPMWTLDEGLEWIKSFSIPRVTARIVGSVKNNGFSRNDLDVLLEGNFNSDDLYQILRERNWKLLDDGIVKIEDGRQVDFIYANKSAFLHRKEL
jgi:hypothetical protein